MTGVLGVLVEAKCRGLLSEIRPVLDALRDEGFWLSAALDAVRILEKSDRLDWDYDGEADVLYVSIGKPRKATGVDIGQGVIVRTMRREESSSA